MTSESTFGVSYKLLYLGLEEFFLIFNFLICFSGFCSDFVSLDLDRTLSEVFLSHLLLFQVLQFSEATKKTTEKSADCHVSPGHLMPRRPSDF